MGSTLSGIRDGFQNRCKKSDSKISEEAAGESILDTGAGSVDAGEDGGIGGQTESTEQSGTKTQTDGAEPTEKGGETGTAENETRRDGRCYGP